MVELEMRLVLGVLVGLGLAEHLALAQVVLHQHRLQRVVGRLGEHALLLQDGQDTHRLEQRKK